MCDKQTHTHTRWPKDSVNVGEVAVLETIDALSKEVFIVLTTGYAFSMSLHTIQSGTDKSIVFTHARIHTQYTHLPVKDSEAFSHFLLYTHNPTFDITR